jgi:DNA replication protein DnaC
MEIKRELEAKLREQFEYLLSLNGIMEVQYNDELDQAFKFLSAYLEKVQDGSKLHKGIILTGNMGTGKTMLLKAFKNLYDNITGITTPLVTGDMLSQCFNPKEGNLLYCKNKARTLFLDDFGIEEVNYYFFKNKVQPFIDTIFYHYNNFSPTESKLFMTTNLTEKKFVDKYGGRVWERIKERSIIICFTGKSMR